MLHYKNNSLKRFRRQKAYFKLLIRVYKLHLYLLKNLKWLLDRWQLNDPFLNLNIHSDEDIIMLLNKDLQSTKDIISKL